MLKQLVIVFGLAIVAVVNVGCVSGTISGARDDDVALFHGSAKSAQDAGIDDWMDRYNATHKEKIKGHWKHGRIAVASRSSESAFKEALANRPMVSDPGYPAAQQKVEEARQAWLDRNLAAAHEARNQAEMELEFAESNASSLLAVSEKARMRILALQQTVRYFDEAVAVLQNYPANVDSLDMRRVWTSTLTAANYQPRSFEAMKASWN